MDTFLVVILAVVLLFGPIALIGWAIFGAFRYRNRGMEISTALPWTAQDSAGHVLSRIGPEMQKWNYGLSSQGDAGLVFSKAYRPIWLIIPCVLLFPIRLLSLIYKRSVQIVFSFHSLPSGSQVAVSGMCPSSLHDDINASLNELASVSGA